MVLSVVLSAACFVVPAAVGQDEPAKYKPMPWHLIDLWWDVGDETKDFTSYSIDFEIAGDVDRDVKLYIAPIGIAELSGQKFYGGVQTQLGRAHTKIDKNWKHGLGRGGIFSRWGERSADAVRVADGGVMESAGYEGDFISVRRPMKWGVGKYTYRVAVVDRLVIDGEHHTWVGAFITDHQRQEETYIGALRFAGEELELGDKAASFVEIYGSAIDPDTIPRVTVTFSNLRANGEAIDVKRCEAVYPDGVPDYAEARAGEGEDRSVVVEVGRRIDDRKKRREKLL